MVVWFRYLATFFLVVGLGSALVVGIETIRMWGTCPLTGGRIWHYFAIGSLLVSLGLDYLGGYLNTGQQEG